MFSFTRSAYSGGTRSPSLRPTQIDAINTDKGRKLPVGVQNDIAVHEHRLVNAVAQLGKQFRRGARAFHSRWWPRHASTGD